MNRRTFLASLACTGVASRIASGAIEFAKECNVAQGFNFKPNDHHTFGYINTFTVGDSNIAPDIKVIDPLGMSKGTTADPNSNSIFKKSVVAVLSNTSWSTLPNDNISFKARISVANAQQLQMLTMQSIKKMTAAISFVVYEYDLVNQVYFTSFLTYKGSLPTGLPPKPGNSGFPEPANIIYGLINKTPTDFGIKIGTRPETDPLGMKNQTLELSLAPSVSQAPQQILIQTSANVKLIQPWGLPYR